MLGVEGQYRALFTIGEYKDFLTEEQLHCFKIIEETGNALPTFELILETMDEKILKYFNEGNILTVAMGRTANELTESVLIPTKVVPVKKGEHKFLLRIVGLYSNLPYIVDQKISITSKKTSIAAIESIVKPKFSFTTNVKPSDAMCWIQPNITDRAFVSHIWMHTYIPNSYPAIAITLNGEFRYMDVKALAIEPYKFRFTNKIETDKDILFEAPYEIKTASTFMNNVAAYGKKKLVANLEAGNFTFLEQNPTKPTLSLSDKTITSKDVTPKYDDHSYQSADNVHLNFWKARLQNSVGLFGISTVKVTVPFINIYKKIHPLDLIYFKEEEPQSNRKYSSESVTGLYVVSKVSRMIENRQFKTQVEFVRETPNSSRGNFSETVE